MPPSRRASGEEGADQEGAPGAGEATRAAFAGSATETAADDATRIAPGALDPGDEDGTLLETAPLPPPDGERPTLAGEAPATGDPSGAATAGSGAVDDGEESPGEEGPLSVGLPFGSRYVILKTLGIGGMGAVYQAWDQELGVPVALKVIRTTYSDPSVAEEMSARFKRELLLARGVTHRNVVRIHDLGEFEGMKYFTMSFVEGEDLGSMLKREKKLSVPRALDVFRQIVDGMLAAHEKGIVHRDLKPANVMIDKEGNALLMDFGIARSSEQLGTEAAGIDAETLEKAGTTTSVNLGKTIAGTIVGTLEYMAPEQFKGRVADQRADVYALGLILYDLILGRRIASARSAIDELKSRMEVSPLAARSAEESVPDALNDLIGKCLEPDPNKRFQTTAELKEALDRLDDEGRPLPKYSRRTKVLAGLAATAVIAALVSTYYLARGRGVVAQPDPMTVLVADFVNDTGDPTFDGAVEQALGIALEGASFISSFPRGDALSTAKQLQSGSSLDETISRLIARREGIDAIIVGSVEPDGSRFRISAEALDPALDRTQGRPLARARVRARDRNAVLAAINKLGFELRRKLGDTPSEGADRAATETVTAASLQAMQAYSEGQEFSYQGRFEDAIQAYRRAVEEDPAFGRAYAAMGTQYTNLRQLDKAEENYQQALQHLDRMTERERYRTMAAYYLGISRNYDKAIESLEKLVKAYPADRTGHMNLAYASVMTRNFDRAVKEQTIALELDPNSLVQRINYAMYSMYAGNFEAAIEQARGIVEETSGQEGGFANRMHSDAIFTIGRAAAAAGDLETARASFREMRDQGLNASQAVLGEADVALLEGLPERALAIVDPWIEASTSEGTVDEALGQLLVRAEALLELGRTQEAIAEASMAADRSSLESVLYPAARVLLAAGENERALAIASQLENMLQSQTVSYAELIRGEIALRESRLLPATEALTDAGQRYDSWFAHLLLGRAYLEAGLGPDALNELVQAVERKGEMTDFFIVDGATLRYWPQALYWQGRAQELLGSADAAQQSYRAFLEIRGGGRPNELTRDAEARLGALAPAA